MTDSKAVTCLCCASENIEHWATTRDLEYSSLDEDFDFFRCHSCDVLFIDPVPLDKLDVIYPANYYSYSETEESFVFRVKHQLDARFFKKILSSISGEQLNILDVGGGVGEHLDLIRKIDPRVSSTQVVDLDSAAEAKAQARGHSYFCGRIEDFNTDTKFDLVLMFNLIEHVANPASVMSHVQRLLSTSGVALIQTPNFESLDARLFRNRNWGGYHCPRHWVLFNESSLRKLVEDARLNVRSLDYTQGASFWALSMLFQLKRFGVLKIDAEHPAVDHPMYSAFAALFAGVDFVRLAFGVKTSQFLITVSRR